MAHTHFCEVCKQPVAHCDDPCQHEGKHYCSVHVPPELHASKKSPYFGKRVEDKPTVRMTVRVDNSEVR